MADRLPHRRTGLCKRVQNVCCRACGGINVQAREQHDLPINECTMTVRFICSSCTRQASRVAQNAIYVFVYI